MKRARGFTLLEMMIAMAILSGALTWLVAGMSSNIRAENHAKLMTTATFLARGKMIDIEDQLYDKGFGEFDSQQDCSFEDKGFKRFGCQIIVDKVELPNAEQVQTAMSQAQQAQQALQGQGGAGDQKDQPQTPLSMLGGGANGQSGSGNPLSAAAGMLGTIYPMVKNVFEQGVRRVTVKVTWNEGRRPEEVSVVAYYTDVRVVDQTIQLGIPGAAGAGAPGGTGAPGASSSSSSSSSGSGH